jgi:MFS transporter, SP family, galactose:H+ symporter
LKVLGKSLGPYSLFVIFTSSISGFLSGYYTAIISGAMRFIFKNFEFDLAKESSFVSVLLLGAILGSSVGGYLTHKLGRKKVFMLTCFLLVAGCLMLVDASNYRDLMFSRGMQGIGIGLISIVVPLYLSEIAPIDYRGGVVSVFQLMMNLGILAAYFVNYYFAVTGSWKLMFLVGLIPVFLQFFFIFFIPESPLWLFKKVRMPAAFHALEKLRMCPSFFEAPCEESSKISSKMVAFLLLIGVLLGGIQQVTGINTVICYAPRIFRHAGYTTPVMAIFATLSLGFANLIGCLISLWLLDHSGRRKLLLTGIFGMMVSLASLSIFSYFEVSFLDTLSVCMLVAYVFFFSIGPGPVTWVLLSEIYPPQIKDKAMTLALISNWICVYFVLLAFPYLLVHFKIAGTFGIFSFINLIAFLFILKCIPETKRKTTDEIIGLFKRGKIDK